MSDDANHQLLATIPPPPPLALSAPLPSTATADEAAEAEAEAEAAGPLPLPVPAAGGMVKEQNVMKKEVQAQLWKNRCVRVVGGGGGGGGRGGVRRACGRGSGSVCVGGVREGGGGAGPGQRDRGPVCVFTRTVRQYDMPGEGRLRREGFWHQRNASAEAA